MTWLGWVLTIGGVIAFALAAVWAIEEAVDAFLDATTREES